MSFEGNSRTEIPLPLCVYAESYVLKYRDVEQIDMGRELSAFWGR